MQEKEREKKHKKEKRNKEKKEKDRSGKHRDKKEKKEKHKDNKEIRKEKNNGSDDKKVSLQSDRRIEEKTSNEREFSEKPDDHYVGVFSSKGNERDSDMSTTSVESKLPVQVPGCNFNYVTGNSHGKESTHVQEFGKRTREEDKRTGKQVVQRLTGSNEQSDRAVVQLAAKLSNPGIRGREANNIHAKLESGGVKAHSRFTASSSLTRVDGLPKPLEKDFEKEIESKTLLTEGDDKGKHKDKKKGQGKHKDKGKEKRREDKLKEKTGRRVSESDKSKEWKNILKTPELDRPEKRKNVDLILSPDVLKSVLSPEKVSGSDLEGSLRKRKDSDTNGIPGADEVRPSKLPRPASSSHQLPYGRILEALQSPISSESLSIPQGGVNNGKLESKKQVIAGIIDSQHLSVSSTQSPAVSSKNPSPARPQLVQIRETPRRPPSHPDVKYLSKILMVPKMEEWSEINDQEWLFSRRDNECEKARVASATAKVDEPRQVWSEAVRIESVDMAALPYVVPF
ncbi:hypothetical protein LINGRAHAP2_LOCUS10720 [Linum grandiflorum]